MICQGSIDPFLCSTVIIFLKRMGIGGVRGMAWGATPQIYEENKEQVKKEIVLLKIKPEIPTSDFPNTNHLEKWTSVDTSKDDGKSVAKSCQDLRQLGHFINEFYTVFNLKMKKIETIYWNFDLCNPHNFHNFYDYVNIISFTYFNSFGKEDRVNRRSVH